MVEAIFALPGCRHPKKFRVKLNRTASVQKCNACGEIIADSLTTFKRWTRMKRKSCRDSCSVFTKKDANAILDTISKIPDLSDRVYLMIMLRDHPASIHDLVVKHLKMIKVNGKELK